MGATNGSEVVGLLPEAEEAETTVEVADRLQVGGGGGSWHSRHWLPSWHCVRVCGLILIISLTSEQSITG